MTHKPQMHRWFFSSLIGLALVSLPRVGSGAAQNVQVNPTGVQTNGNASDTGLNNWGTYWITAATGATFTITFDATMRSAASIPGSVFCVCDWNGTVNDDINLGATLPSGNSTWLGNPAINAIDGTAYAYLLIDIFWTNVSGITSWPEIGLMTPNYGRVALTNNVPIPATPGWQHMVIPIDPSLANLSSIAGVYLYRWQPAGSPAHAELWIDNVQVIAKLVATPPPTLSLTKVVPGLTQFSDTPPTYNRQNIRTDTSGTADVTWFGRTKPVTYSWTIADFPGPGHAGFTVGFNITPDPPASQVYPDADWSATNDLYISIGEGADGSGNASIAYKTNQPSGNGQFGTAPTLLVPGNFRVPSAIGKWTLTFTSDTAMTLTGPNGAVTNASLPANVAALYNGPVGVSLFSQPNTTANIGQHMTFSSFHITGVGTPVNEDLTSGALSSPFLILMSQNYGNNAAPPNQQFVTSADAWWLHWTRPDSGFGPITRSPLTARFWNDLNLTTFLNGSDTWLKVPKADLPAATQSYFALVKRVFSQLQVLLPGETNAPNTLTGKIGTPAPQTNAIPFNVVVNACDSTWHLLSSTDTVHLDSADNTGIPGDIPMANGTATFSVYYLTTSQTNYTITASDVTTNTITSATSAPVTVYP
ncbi:MAG TPA: hypothetical protein VN578_08365 [Candidatus Binatia bacterium]|jgi:hypothetical protein|nr:hypothetical protein [Candidatus Binatia bacterium]